MSNTFLKQAQEWGVRQALEQAGYQSVEEVYKEAAALGLVAAPAPAPKTASDLSHLFRTPSK